ncbi:MAG: hypothetical protein ACAH22_02340 [Tardiphaga sp.]
MVDRPTLIKALHPIARPTSSQAEDIRKTLEKALTDIVFALPLMAARQLPVTERTELTQFLRRLDPKSLEKLAKVWEPKRKLDLELRRTLASDIVALVEEERQQYEPIKMTLDAARGDAAAIRPALAHTPAKDLTAMWKAWDKHNKLIPDQRSALLQRLHALLNGEAPMSPPKKERSR